MRTFYKCLLGGFDLSFTCLSLVVFISISLSVKAQHNYDNQSIIYSRNGNVGIGNMSPTEKLEINGNIKARGSLQFGTGSQDRGFIIKPFNQSTSFIPKLNTGHHTYAFYSATDPNDVSTAFVLLINRNRDGTSTTPVKISGADRWTDHTYFNHSGNFGIGTTNPSEKLEVNGNIKARGSLQFGTGSQDRGFIIKPFNQSTSFIPKLNTGHHTYAFYSATDPNDVSAAFVLLINRNRDGTSTTPVKISGADRWTDHTYFNHSGNFGIGTTNPTEKLEVNGTVKAKNMRANGLKVYGEASAKKFRTSSTGADFVFEPDYKLLKLEEVAEYVKDHKHLPDIAPAKTMQKEGIDLGEMNTKLLQKVEELTLYLIEQNKKLKSLEEKVKILEQR